jgi:hypothetical protein
MTVQYSTSLRNAIAATKEATVGTAPIVRLYDGTPPANPGTALAGNTLLAEGTLPSDWLTAPSSGAVSKNGAWTITGQAGASTGTVATFYRIYASDGTTCHEQGTVTITGGGGDMTVDNPNNTYTTTAGHA